MNQDLGAGLPAFKQHCVFKSMTSFFAESSVCAAAGARTHAHTLSLTLDPLHALLTYNLTLPQREGRRGRARGSGVELEAQNEMGTCAACLQRTAHAQRTYTRAAVPTDAAQRALFARAPSIAPIACSPPPRIPLTESRHRERESERRVGCSAAAACRVSHIT